MSSGVWVSVGLWIAGLFWDCGFQLPRTELTPLGPCEGFGLADWLSMMTVLSSACSNILFLLTLTCRVQLDCTRTCSFRICFDSLLTCLSCEVWICQNHSLPKLKIVVCVLEGQCPSAAHTGTFLAPTSCSKWPTSMFPGSLWWFCPETWLRACDLRA